MKSKNTKVSIIVALIVAVMALTGCAPKVGDIVTAKSDVFVATSGGHYVCQIKKGDQLVVDVVTSGWDEQVREDVTHIKVHELGNPICEDTILADLVNN